MLQINFGMMQGQIQAILQDESSAVLDTAKSHFPHLELLNDKARTEFNRQLKVCVASGDFGEEFIDAARQIAEKCKDSAYLAMLQRELGTIVQVTNDGITFSTKPPRFDHRDPGLYLGHTTQSLEVLFEGGQVKGYWHRQLMCSPAVTNEIVPEKAAKYIFNSASFESSIPVYH